MNSHECIDTFMTWHNTVVKLSASYFVCIIYSFYVKFFSLNTEMQYLYSQTAKHTECFQHFLFFDPKIIYCVKVWSKITL